LLCCALGIAAVVTVPAWRRLLFSPGSRIRTQVVAIVGISIFGAALVGIVAAHSFFHRASPADAITLSHLCGAPSLTTADFRAPDRVAQARGNPTF